MSHFIRDMSLRSTAPKGRVITVVAVGFLALDGALLLLAGAWSGRLGLGVWGGVFLVGAVVVVVFWRRHVRRLAELRADLEASSQEFARLQRELDQNRSN